MSAAPRTAIRDNKIFLRGLLFRQVAPGMVLLAMLYVIARKSTEINLDNVMRLVSAIDPWQWIVSIGAGVVSFWAVGQMESVVHRVLRTNVNLPCVKISGIASIASAQLTGFGLLTGTLARWRLLPSLQIWEAARVTLAVSVSFLFALGTISAAMVLIAKPSLVFAQPIAVLAVFLFLAAMLISLWRPRFLWSVKIPPVRAQVTLIGYAVIDTAAAALALYVFIPTAYLPDFALFYSVFLIALGAGLLGATPGGVGPFELILLSSLPMIPEPQILAAIMGFRIAYYAVPGCIAFAILLFGPTLLRHKKDGTLTYQINPAPEIPLARLAFSYTAHRAEVGLFRQGDFELLSDHMHQPQALVATTANSMIMLGDPFTQGQRSVQILSAIDHLAGSQYLTPCLYKCGNRTASLARSSGWKVFQIAQEAIVCPLEFDPTSPGYRQLRRHLQKAQKSGVTVVASSSTPPLADMMRIANDWAHNQGKARGFSMGQFTEPYILNQRVFLAFHNARLVGFITLHESYREYCLDLMCHSRSAPAGTMQLLIATAINEAASKNCSAVSLAAVPTMMNNALLPGFGQQILNAKFGAQGLRQFKSSFRPRWRPLFMAAPDHLGMVLAGIDLTDRITRPRQFH